MDNETATTTNRDIEIAEMRLEENDKFKGLVEKSLKKSKKRKAQITKLAKWKDGSQTTRIGRGEGPFNKRFFLAFIKCCSPSRKTIKQMLQLKNATWKDINYKGKGLTPEEAKNLPKDKVKYRYFKHEIFKEFRNTVKKSLRKKSLEKDPKEKQAANKRLDRFNKIVSINIQNSRMDAITALDICEEQLNECRLLQESRIEDGRLEPHPATIGLVGETLFWGGRPKESKKIFQEIIKIVDEKPPKDKNDPTQKKHEQVLYRCKLARAHNMCGEYKEAKQIAEEAVKIASSINKEKEKIYAKNLLAIKEGKLFKFIPIHMDAYFELLDTLLNILFNHELGTPLNHKELENIEREFIGLLDATIERFGPPEEWKLKIQLYMITKKEWLESPIVNEYLTKVIMNVYQKLGLKSERIDELLDI